MGARVQKILLGFIFAILALPIVNDKLHIIRTEGLRGYFTNAGDVPFTAEQWMEGTFQADKANYINDQVSFRPDLIRLNAQMNYSLFHMHTTGWGVFGKNNCLLDDNYIRAWNGEDYKGYDTLHTRLVKLKALQDTFAHLGKSLVLVHAASQSFFYADCIPDRYVPKQKKPTNYATCIRIGDSIGLNQVDFNGWFCKMKDTSRELLYSKQCIHWSLYGGMVAADSLVSYIEHLRQIRMRHMRLIGITRTTTPRYPDNDMAAALNLIWPITTETFSYGTYECDTNTAKTRPSAIYIGDSFTWNILDGWVFDCVNSNWQFWFYMKELHTQVLHDRQPKPMPEDIFAEVDKTDCIVLIYSAVNLNRLGNGFIEKAYDHYFPCH